MNFIGLMFIGITLLCLVSLFTFYKDYREAFHISNTEGTLPAVWFEYLYYSTSVVTVYSLYYGLIFLLGSSYTTQDLVKPVQLLLCLGGIALGTVISLVVYSYSITVVNWDTRLNKKLFNWIMAGKHEYLRYLMVWAIKVLPLALLSSLVSYGLVKVLLPYE